jgi:uncharacterized protein (DUF1684 family)
MGFDEPLAAALARARHAKKHWGCVHEYRVCPYSNASSATVDVPAVHRAIDHHTAFDDTNRVTDARAAIQHRFPATHDFMQAKLAGFLCVIVLCSLPSFATQEDSYQRWLEFKNELSNYAGGATGYYAIQDMRELEPGDTAYLDTTDDVERIRWSGNKARNPSVRIEYRSHKALISGTGIESSDLLQLKNRQIQLPNRLIVRASFHGAQLKVWLYNSNLPGKRKFKSLAFFDFDPTGVIPAVFERYDAPAVVTYLDSRDEEGKMYAMGALHVEIHGRSHELKAYSYAKSWKDIDVLLVLLRDRNSGESTYGGGRVTEVHFPKGVPPVRLSIDLNRAYSFLCAHSNFYNCPMALTDYIDEKLNYGEEFPPLFEQQRPQSQ